MSTMSYHRLILFTNQLALLDCQLGPTYLSQYQVVGVRDLMSRPSTVSFDRFRIVQVESESRLQVTPVDQKGSDTMPLSFLRPSHLGKYQAMLEQFALVFLRRNSAEWMVPSGLRWNSMCPGCGLV